MSEYDDIIDLPRPKSAHEPMPMSDRAAQFSPFAALTGYDDAIDETARLTDERIELTEEQRADWITNSSTSQRWIRLRSR